eukprot:6470673-Amphidinium_carterae.2
MGAVSLLVKCMCHDGCAPDATTDSTIVKGPAKGCWLMTFLSSTARAMLFVWIARAQVGNLGVDDLLRPLAAYKHEK